MARMLTTVVGRAAALLLSALALAGLAGPARAAGRHGTCVVSGQHALPMVVTIAAKEAAPFQLRVAGLAADVATGGLEQPAVVTLHAPLAFSGTIAADAIPARTRRAVDALNGMAHLAADTEKLTVHAALRPSRVDVDVRLGGVELRGLVLPCDALTLDDVAAPKPVLIEGDAGERLAPRGKQLTLRSGPGRGESMEIVLDGDDGLELHPTETQGEWLRVTSRWADGTTIAGWARRDELVPAREHSLVGDVGLPPAASACTEEPTVREGERIVAAVVAAGTQIFAARYVGPWARVVDGKALRVRVRPKDDWVELVTAPGIASMADCASATALNDAWLPRSAVKLSDEPPAPKR